MNTYVICMDSAWVRDAEMFDIVGMTNEELMNVDMCNTDNECRWHDMAPTPFIAIISAENEEEACKKAAVEKRYDPRCLFAIKISG